MDAGPIWATRTFPLPAAPPRKSSLYNGPVADAAMECVLEVVAKAADPAFTPVPADHAPTEAPGARPRPLMRQPTGPSTGPSRPSTSSGGSGPRTARRACAPSSAACRSSPTTRCPGSPAARPAGHSCSAAGRAPCWSAPATAASGWATCAAEPTRPGGHQAAGHHAARRAAARRTPLAAATRHRAGVPGRLPAGALPARRRRGLARLRLLQRRDGARALPPPARRAAARDRPGHRGAGAARRHRRLQQRHPPQRHRGVAGPGRAPPGPTSGRSTRSAARSSPVRGRS